MSKSIIALLLIALTAPALADTAVVDTDQDACYDTSGAITCPAEGQSFHGQDAQYDGDQPQYQDNGDGTITDLVTGLMWQQGFTQSTWANAPAAAASATTGGHTDWRVPTTKELYSLMLFSGVQGNAPPEQADPPADAVPFIDTDAFDFEYGSPRYIDAQYVTDTAYTGYVFGNQLAFFGVNFADGRIKGYPQSGGPGGGVWYARYVRGGADYGVNAYEDNGDGTVMDGASGLQWLQADSGDPAFAALLSGYTYQDGSLNWQEALDFAENLVFAGRDDWRLPDAKELHSIVDYTRSPQATGTAAIDPIFDISSIITEAGDSDWPHVWSSTTFLPGSDAIYIAFGEGRGYMNGQHMDVHGAGCQRTDPKEGTPDYGWGPQGDVRRIYNYVRCVRDAGTTTNTGDTTPAPKLELSAVPNPFNPRTELRFTLGDAEHAKLAIFDVAGRHVTTLLDATLEAGEHAIAWNAKGVSSGVYLARLKTVTGSSAVKLVLAE